MGQNKEINFVVLTLPRTGSTFLFDLLSKNGLLVDSPPQSFYEPFHEKMTANLKVKHLNLRDYINRQFDDYAVNYKGCNIRGFKLFPQQINSFLKKYNNRNNKDLDLEDFVSLLPKNTKPIILFRSNKIRQAISLIKAEFTKQWKKDNDLNFKKKFFINSYSQVDDVLSRIEKNEKIINDRLKKCFDEYLYIEYEELKTDTNKTLKAITDYLGIETKGIKVRSSLKVQSNLSSDLWYLRYKFHKSGYKKIYYLFKNIMTIFKKES